MLLLNHLNFLSLFDSEFASNLFCHHSCLPRLKMWYFPLVFQNYSVLLVMMISLTIYSEYTKIRAFNTDNFNCFHLFCIRDLNFFFRVSFILFFDFEEKNCFQDFVFFFFFLFSSFPFVKIQIAHDSPIRFVLTQINSLSSGYIKFKLAFELSHIIIIDVLKRVDFCWNFLLIKRILFSENSSIFSRFFVYFLLYFEIYLFAVASVVLGILFKFFDLAIVIELFNNEFSGEKICVKFIRTLSV